MLYNQIFKGLILALLFSTNLFSDNFTNKLLKLSKNKHWHNLMHYKNGVSQIESKNFFININGHNNSFLELQSTIYELITPNLKNDDSVYCRFPARRMWITKNINTIDIKKQKCEKLIKELSEIKNINQVTLIFPTSHINSPASMFGHTLLRLDDKNGDLLNSFAINYAAFTNEQNGLVYAWKGLTGRYKGRYSIIPYFEKLNEYSNMENRDIWEYELNLNEEEINLLKLHLFEVKHTWSSYYYFNRNCSYEILWLLQVSRNSLNLVDEFNYKTLPIETINMAKENDLIKQENYRASKGKILYKYFSLIDNKILAKNFYDSGNIDLLNKENLQQKQYIANYSLEMLRYEKTNNNITKSRYIKKLLKLLRVRSKLGSEKEIKLDILENPLNGHKSGQLTLDILKNNLYLGIKPSFHDQESLNNGFIAGAYIDFFKLELSVNKNKQIYLNNFSLFDIKSYAKRNDLFKPISWKIDVGNERLLNKNYNKIKSGIGLSYGNDKYLNAFLLLVNVHYKNKLEFSHGLEYFYEYNFTNSKIVFDTKYEKYDFFDNKILNLAYIKSITKELNFKLGFYKDSNSKSLKIGLSYYF